VDPAANAKPASTVAVNSTSQDKAGNPATLINSGQQAARFTATPKVIDPNADAPTYVVKAARSQFRDAGLPQAVHPSSADFNAESAPSIKQGQNPSAVLRQRASETDGPVFTG